MSYLNIIPLPDGFDKNTTLINEERLTEIGDSIRDISGSLTVYKPSQMPDAIRDLTFSGFADFYGSGGYIADTGYNAEEPSGFIIGNEYGAPFAIAIGPRVTNIAYLTGDKDHISPADDYHSIFAPACGPNVINMYAAYDRCHVLVGSPVCGLKVIDMARTYNSCNSLVGSPVCGPNVINMEGTYERCDNLTGSPVCGPNVINMKGTYHGCYNLTGSPVCGPNVVNMDEAYTGCNNLTGSPVCGPNVVNMEFTYDFCQNLTGSPVCGPKVVDMGDTYRSCNNLTGAPACGSNVEIMTGSYSSCDNLTGQPNIGENVKYVDYAYEGCDNLHGTGVIPYNVIDANGVFNYCSNLGGIYIKSDQTKLNNSTLRYAFACRHVDADPGFRLNVVFNNYQLYKNSRANSGIWGGATLTADTQLTETVNLPQAYPDGTIYANTQIPAVRGCYNAARNLYVYCME